MLDHRCSQACIVSASACPVTLGEGTAVMRKESASGPATPGCLLSCLVCGRNFSSVDYNNEVGMVWVFLIL